MGVYYNFYLDKNIGDDKWLSIIVDDTDIIYYMRSRHWLYDEWDDSCSEYYYLYEIMPIIEKALKDNNLEYKNVRLLCNIC